MPNQVTYSDDKTITKVLRALIADGFDVENSLAMIEAVQNAGILFREIPPKGSQSDTE